MTAIAPIAAYLLYLTIYNHDSHFCTPDERNPLNNLADSLGESVCALYSGNDQNSVSGFYQKTLTNSQTACQDINVIAYTFGECEANPIQICSSNTLSTDSSSSDSEGQICSFSEKRRLGGKTQEVLLTSLASSTVCQNTNNAFYVKVDCATLEPHEEAICTVDKRARAKKQDFLVEKKILSEDSKCVYFTGENCKGLKVCRRTEKISDSLCSNEDILFYTEAPCDDATTIAEEIDPNAVLYLSNDVPEVEAETMADRSVVMIPVGEIKAPEGGVVKSIVQTDKELDIWDLSNDTPELEAEVMPDGSIKLTPKNPRFPSQEPKEDEIDPDAVLDLGNDVPEVEAETMADGSIVMTPVGEILPPEGGVVQPLRNSDDEPLDLSNDVPEVEAETLPDGSVVMTPVVPLSEQALPGEVQDLGDDVPEVKEEAMVEGGVVMTPEGEQSTESTEAKDATTTTTTTSTTTSTTTTKSTTTSTSHTTESPTSEEPKGLKIPEKVLKAVEFVIVNNAGGIVGRSAQELSPEVEPSN